MIKKKFASTYFFCIFIILLSGNVFADGCFFRAKEEQVGNSAESPNQRALIVFDKNRETLVVQVKYQGDAEKFSWVLPVPSIPEENSITTVSDSIFTHLHDRTQPKLYIYSTRNYGKGSMDAGSNSDAEIYQETGVNVWENLQVGPYKIAVISSSTSQALINWLAENGYDFPQTAQQIVEFYTQKSWYFVAVRVNVSNRLTKDSSTYQAGLPAIKMMFKTEKPVFPLRISELTSSENNEIELYVATRHRMTCDGYNTTSMNQNEVQQLLENNYLSQHSKSSGFNCACDRMVAPEPKPELEYETYFQQKLMSFAEPTFIVEYASNGYETVFDYTTENYDFYYNEYMNDYFSLNEEFWITRFRTILSPQNMTDDVFFKRDPNGNNYLTLHFWIEEKQPNPWSYSIYVTPGFLIFPIFFSKRIRKKYSKHLFVSVFLLLIAIV